MNYLISLAYLILFIPSARKGVTMLRTREGTERKLLGGIGVLLVSFLAPALMILLTFLDYLF